MPITASKIMKAKEVSAQCKNLMGNTVLLLALELELKKRFVEVKSKFPERRCSN